MDVTLAVIIPNYNNAKYLKQCIESVMSQSYQPKEIIIFDDASTDNSVELLKSIESLYQNVRVIYSEDNVGVSLARHRAILETHTSHITVLDSDDYYASKDKLQREMQVVYDRLRRGEKNACSFSQTVIVPESGLETKARKLRHLGWSSRFRLVTRLYHNFIPRDFCFSKEDYLEVGGYQSDLKLYEDWDLCLRLLQQCEFVFSKEYGTAYRQRKNGLSKVDGRTNFRVKKDVFNKDSKVLSYTFMEKSVFHLLLYLSYIKTLFRENKFNKCV